MLGNFTFHNPTKLYFGENSLENLGKELGKYGEKVTPFTPIPCPDIIRWQAFTTSCHTFWNNTFRGRTTTRPTTSPKG